MQSKTSLFNKFLYVKTLLRYWPLWVIVSIGGILTAALSVAGNYSYRYQGNYAAEVFGNEATGLFLWVIIIYAIVIAMCVWSYLYSKNSNHFYHSLPVTRGGLFVTHFLAGLTMMYIPFILAAVVQIAMLASGSSVVCKELFFAFAVAGAEGFMFFSFATMVAFITSNFVALPVLYGVFNFLAFTLKAITDTFREGMYPGVTTSSDAVVEFLSPAMWIAANIDYVSWTEYDERAGRYVVIEHHIENANYLWIVLFMGAVFIALAVTAYKTKRNEEVGKTVSIKWLRPVLLVIFVYGSALTGAIVAYTLGSGFTGRNYYSIPVMIGLTIIFAIVALYTGLMILSGTTRIFNKRTIMAGAFTITFFVLMNLSCGYDWFHSARNIPDLSEVKSVHLSVSTFDGEFDTTDSKELVAEVINISNTLVKESEYIRNHSGATNNDGYYYGGYNLVVKYMLKDGKSVNKYYTLPIDETRVETEGTYEYVISKFMNREDITLLRNKLVDDYIVYDITIFNNGINMTYPVPEDYYDEIIDATKKDVIENNALKYTWFEYTKNDREAVLMEMSFHIAEDSAYVHKGWEWNEFEVTSDMTNLVNVLEKYNLLNPEGDLSSVIY